MQRMRTVKSMKKGPPTLAAPVALDPEVESQMELELCWCVQQLEKALDEGKLSKKHQEDTMKNLKILKSTTAPVIKKLQVMRAAFGDYRSKMKEEEKKLQMAANQIKFTQTDDEVSNKSRFVKKSAILTSGKDFRFNFTPDTTCDSTSDGTDVTKPCDNQPSKSFALISNDLNLSSSSEFKFNFVIDDVNSISSLDKRFNNLLSSENGNKAA